METGFYRVKRSGEEPKILLFLKGHGFFLPVSREPISLDELKSHGFLVLEGKYDIRGR
ncbi:hypothetical protein GCM10009414_20550 [Tatumella terrea]